MKVAGFLVLLAGAGAIQAQSWDTSRSGLLKGRYYFRQVTYAISDKYGDLNSGGYFAGKITFDGNAELLRDRSF